MSLCAGIDAGTQGIKLVEAAAPLGLNSEDGSREQLASWWIVGARSCFAHLDAGTRGARPDPARAFACSHHYARFLQHIDVLRRGTRLRHSPAHTPEDGP